jgi:hypothetical protein
MMGTFAKWSVTSHNRRRGPKPEGGPLEVQTRRILEDLTRRLEGATMKSQDARWDFGWCGLVVDVQDERSHAKQTQRNHDGYKASKAIEEGLVPVYILEPWLKNHPDLVSALMRTYAVLQGATIKEACA